MQAKVVIYVVLILAVGALVGTMLMKLNNTSENPATADTRTQEQKVNALEQLPGMTSPAAKRFVQNEQQRRGDTKDAVDQVGDK